MANRRRLIIIALIILLIGGLWYSIQGILNSPPKQEQNINLGVILPLSGSAAYYGDSSQKGIEIAREELEEKFPDLHINVYYADSIYTPKEGVNSYLQLRNSNSIDAVITAASHVSLAIAPLAQKDNILQMAIFSSADKYTSPNDLTFRTSTKSDIETSAMAEFIIKKNYNRIGIIYLNNDFGVSFKDSLKKNLENSPVEIIAEEGILLESQDFRTLLTKIKDKNPDAVVLASVASHYGQILKQAHELDVNIPLISMRSAEDPILLQTAGALAEGFIYTYPFDANAKEAEYFAKKFTSKYQRIPDAYAAEGYEGFKLLGMAFQACEKDYVCMKEYLENLEYQSVFGPLHFDKNGDVYYNYFLKTIKNGKFTRLE